MLIKDIISSLEELAPLNYAEGFDNVGLLTGSPQWELTGVLVSLDAIEKVVDEAIERDCNLIVSFHPIVFSGLKRFSGSSYVEKSLIKAIKNDIAIFAIHTALDNQFKGVNHMIAQRLNLENQQILIPQTNVIKKLVTYVPHNSAQDIRDALFRVGAGSIGNYDHCSFNLNGKGTFKGNDDSDPVIGEKGELQIQDETLISVTFPRHLQRVVKEALLQAHPYEEVAYEITTIENEHQHLGMGMLGELKEHVKEEVFLKLIKEKFNTGCIRHSTLLNKPIKKVAVLGGSGSFAIDAALRAKADIYITADLKYHDFFKAEGELVLADIGHFESEQFTKDLLCDYLSEKFPNFAILLSHTNTNPIKYF